MPPGRTCRGRSAQPQWATGIPRLLRFDKAPVRWLFRPATWPVWNHVVRQPVLIWSVHGPNEDALAALAGNAAGPLWVPAPSKAERRERARVELDACLTGLRRATENYREPEWRHEHTGVGFYPEDHLWNAARGAMSWPVPAERAATPLTS